jgi:hypothetical protein
MATDTTGEPGDYYESRRSVQRRPRHRRRDRLAQVGVVLLAVAAGVVAGKLGTHRTWEHPAPVPTSAIHPAVPLRP